MPKDNLTFTLLSGPQGLLHPQEKIKETNRLIAENGPFVPYQKIDYAARQESTQIGFVELWGARESQEDRVVVGEVPQFKSLSEQARKKVLKNLIQMLQANITKTGAGNYQGSTLCVAIVADNKVYTVNVGDSTAFLIIIQSNKQVKAERLNKDLHHPTTEKERRRIEESGGRVFGGRVAGILALSRAMGDNQFEKAGLSHDPDIYVTPIDAEQGEQVFVVVACDGLTEADVMTEISIAEVVAANKDNSAELIANELAMAAYNNGSGDNISVVVMPIEAQTPKVKYAAVFDGHGGDQVAEELSLLFAQKLAELIEA